MPLAKLLCLL